MSILDYAPGDLRDQQRDVLLAIEYDYRKNDVFVISAPVASGKSWIIITLARWLEAEGHSSAILTPTKMLQDQYSSEFPAYPTLKGANNYACREQGKTCADKPSKKRCVSCPYVAVKSKAQTSGVAVFNHWTYLSNKMFNHHNHLLIDEAHTTNHIINDLSTIVVRQSKTGFPNNLHTIGDVAHWLELEIRTLKSALKTYGDEKVAKAEQKLARYERCYNDIRLAHNDYHFEIKEENGDKTLSVVPLSTRKLPGRLWPRSKVKKIFLFSATIDNSDLTNFGLHNRRCQTYICTSPIPAKQRKVISLPEIDMSFKNRQEELPKLVSTIRTIAAHHSNVKGLIHCTYGVASQLRVSLGSDKRFIWHNKEDKMEKYAQFRETKEPVILIASGMEEGIDLAYEYGRWQIIASLPFAYLGDSWVKSKMKKEPEWYERHTARVIQQQTGRICRTPTDEGITYILDKRFTKFYNKTIDLWPKWFTESIIWTNGM